METNVANSHYSLNNSENYKTIITDSINDIIEKYYLLVNEYMNFITDNIAFKNVSYTKFIIEINNLSKTFKSMGLTIFLDTNYLLGSGSISFKLFKTEFVVKKD